MATSSKCSKFTVFFLNVSKKPLRVCLYTASAKTPQASSPTSGVELTGPHTTLHERGRIASGSEANTLPTSTGCLHKALPSLGQIFPIFAIKRDLAIQQMNPKKTKSMSFFGTQTYHSTKMLFPSKETDASFTG